MMTWADRYAAAETSRQALAYVAGAGLLGVGLAFSSAPDHPMTIVMFTIASVIILAGFAGWPRVSTSSAPHLRRVGFAAVALQFGFLLVIRPEYFIPRTPGFDGTPYVIGVTLSTVVGIAGMVSGRRWGVGALALLTVLHLALGAWLIVATTVPLSDVWVFQQIGSEELLHGHNPYAITRYPDLYGPGSPLYAPGLVRDGFLTFGFSYPPLSLLMALSGWAVFGDHRFAQLVAMSVAAWLIATARPGRFALVPALLFLFTARSFLVLQQGWTDPFLVLLLAVTVWLAVRGRAGTTVALGLTIAVKQHMLVTLPLGAILLRRAIGRPTWRIAGIAMVVAGLITIPFVVWDYAAFVRSAILLHLEQPFRADSMSYVAWLGANGQPGLPLWIGFALLIPATGLALARAPRTPAGFAAATGVVLLVFFLFSKQAFVHYYYLVIGCLCVAAAAIPTSVAELVHGPPMPQTEREVTLPDEAS